MFIPGRPEILGIVSVILTSLVLLQSASAAGFDMKVELFQPVSTCPTIMQDTPPLNKGDMPIYVTNFLDRPDTYKMTLDLPQGWSGFIEPDFFVEAGKSKLLDPFWITVPDVKPGVYKITVNAMSSSSSEKLSRTFEIEVQSCHNVDIDAPEKSQNVCSEDLETIQYVVKVTNTGKSSETYDIGSLYKGNAVAWIRAEPKAVSLNPGQSKDVSVFVSPPVDVLGQQEVVVSASSPTTNAIATDVVKFNSGNCQSFTAALSPVSQNLCLGESSKFTLNIQNTGSDDSYSISSSDVVQVQSSVSIANGKSVQLPVTVKPSSTGKSDFSITVVSNKDKTDSKTVKGSIDVVECRDIAVVVTPFENSVCSGTSVDYSVLVKNTGSLKESVTLTSDLGKFDTPSITIEPGKTQSAKLTVPADFTGQKNINVVAKGQTVSDKTFAVVTAENCYAGSLKIQPTQAQACACDNVDFDLIVSNTGKLADTLTLSFGDNRQEVTVNPGQEKKVSYTYPVDCKAKAGQSTIDVQAKGAHLDLKQSAQLSIIDMATCYGSKLSVDDSLKVKTAQSIAIPVTVENTGIRDNSFQVKLTGPNWVYLEPTAVSLAGKQKRDVFVYISPPIEVKDGNYDVAVQSEGKFTKADVKFGVDVSQSLKFEQPSQQSEENEYAGTEDNKSGAELPKADEGKKGVSLNLSIPNSTVSQGQADKPVVAQNKSQQGQKVTGQASALAGDIGSGLRVIAVAVITLVIIAVLVIRFITLSK